MYITVTRTDTGNQRRVMTSGIESWDISGSGTMINFNSGRGCQVNESFEAVTNLILMASLSGKAPAPKKK